MKTKLVKDQKMSFTKDVRPVSKYDYDKITVTIRYDDRCGNGYNTFSITGETTCHGVEDMCGCIHEEIEKHFPALKRLIKWHLVSSDGPLNYISNTTYMASDKDCWGLRKGEEKQIVNGRTGKPSWKLAPIEGEGKEGKNDLKQYVDSDTKPGGCVVYAYVPWCRIGEGKEPNLEGARSAAIWPDATIDQLQDVDALETRLPSLMEAFRADMVDIGFEY